MKETMWLLLLLILSVLSMPSAALADDGAVPTSWYGATVTWPVRADMTT